MKNCYDSHLFHEIPDSAAILRCKGKYTQTVLAHRGDYIYAKHGNGYILIMRSGTSLPEVSVAGMNVPKYSDYSWSAEGKLVFSKSTLAVEPMLGSNSTNY